MADKLPTAIGQVIEGKFISITICHECRDVSNHFLNCSLIVCCICSDFRKHRAIFRYFFANARR